MTSELRELNINEVRPAVRVGVKDERDMNGNTQEALEKKNGAPKTPPRPSYAKLRRRSTLEWVNASPQSRQQKLEGVTAERMADVFFSLHVEDIDGKIMCISRESGTRC